MIIQTKNSGKAEVIGDGSKYGYLKLRFIDTGNIDEFRKDAVFKGEVRDKYKTTLCGVGVIGNIKTRGKYKQYYVTWRNMITRCYKQGNNAYYGKVTVCNEWLIFENFYKSVCCVDGWNKEMFESGLLVLDKDIKQRREQRKVYSASTCTWTTKQINACIQDGQQNIFVAISPSGETFQSNNITQFAREHSLERRQISSVLHGRFKQTLGWKFYFIDKEIV